MGWIAEILVLFFRTSIKGEIQFAVTSTSEFTITKYLALICFKPSLYPPANPRFFSSEMVLILRKLIFKKCRESSDDPLSIT